MSTHNHILSLLLRIELPPQTQDKLAFCDSTRAIDVARWAAKLPATQVNRTSALLYNALPEISRLQTTPNTRLKMLEHLRPYVQSSTQGLSQTFLNQSLRLNEEAMRAAIIAQALQKHMSSGYVRVIQDLLNAKAVADLSKSKHLELIQALHRALTGMSMQLLLSSQLYTQVSAQLWLNIHTLFQLAQLLEIENQSCADASSNQPKFTLKQLYLRCLLLASSQPNQLRQQTILALFEALPSWSRLVNLEPYNDDTTNLLFINQARGEGPFYKTRFNQQAHQKSTDTLFSLNVEPLLKVLQKQQQASSHARISISKQLQKITDHLIDCWSQRQQRRQQRNKTSEKLEVTVGLRNIHFNVCDGMEFTAFTQTNSHHNTNLIETNKTSCFTSKETSDNEDPWNDAFDAPGHTASFDANAPFTDTDQPSADALQKDHPVIEVSVHDSSPNGYCLNWHSQSSLQVKTGELIAIRKPALRHWSIAVIRWVKQTQVGSQTGIELIAPKIEPLAVKKIQTSGEPSSFMRALLTTPMNTVSQTPTLITTAGPFKTRNKVILNSYGTEKTSVLIEELLNTAAICQYRLQDLQDIQIDGDPEDDFSNEW